MAGKDDNLFNNFGPYKDGWLALKRSNIEEDDINLVSKSSDTESYSRDMLLGCIPQNGLLESKLLSSLKEIRLKDLEFVICISIFNIKQNHLRFKLINFFIFFIIS